MPIRDYGVWKAKPVRFTYETDEQDHISPHLSLFFTISDNSRGEGRAAINVKSGDKSDSRLVFWLVKNFENFNNDILRELKPGFHGLGVSDEQRPGGLALDYIRGNLFHRESGRLLPHDIPGLDNDILDQLIPVIDGAIDQDATMYIYGSHFSDGQGIHNVHMNQGSPRKYQKDNGIYQDGGMLLDFGDHWTGVFLGFASQAAHTDDHGQPTPPRGYLSWNDILNSELPEEQRGRSDIKDRPVIISDALLNPVGPDGAPTTRPEMVTLANRTDTSVKLDGWSFRNKDGDTEELPDGASLPPKRRQSFQLQSCALSNKGGLITLLNAQGMKVDGVRYTAAMAKPEGHVISF
ncbi:hypothetical protein BDV29DRAFT_187771 [Aspergillus leporis]|jgi:uncharacterized protein YukJ|uniref:LTD domain-containing protein n=1 Tax=Aspergillus leporis TaxID=41062 RepID=A0A5N5XD79_9EURO|nr:hypothetical protein BDV29DRAFT_187771 [Aspergillus leporis]